MDWPKRNLMAGLPDEAMLEILARTPFRSISRSKCVAKAWRDLIDDPLNRKRLPQTLQGFFSRFFRMGKFEHCFVKYSASSVALDIDLCLSFLPKLPEIQILCLVDSCNGLLLFRHTPKWNLRDVWGYIVCNPTTKHWVTVPVCACYPPSKALSNTYLAFDPAVSPHFHLIQFSRGTWGEEASSTSEKTMMLALSVHTYSSETGVWSHSQTDGNEEGQLEVWRRQGITGSRCGKRTFVNGILYLMVKNQGRDQIVVVDVQGRTKKTIKIPTAAEGRRSHSFPFIGQSLGRLHYINQDFDATDTRQAQSQQSYGLSIWVLQDCDTQEWVLKDTVSFHRLFGRLTANRGNFNDIFIHPDRNVVFCLHPMYGLIAYDMDSKEVSVVATSSEKLVGKIVPYIPCFLESPSLINKN